MLSGGRHCRPGERRTGGALARPGERRTENGEQNARQARDGWGVEKMDKPPNLDRLNAARLSQRTRRTTKIHKARRRGNRRFWRTQRITEKTEDHRVGRSATARRTQKGKFGSLEAWKFGQSSRCAAITKNTKDHKGSQRGRHDAEAGRACAQGARPARGPEGAWRASHAMRWVGETTMGARRRGTAD